MPTLWEYEAEFIQLMAQMKKTGIKIDREFCKPKVTIGEAVCHSIKQDLRWNPASPIDLEQFLIKDMGFPVVKRSKKTGRPSFDKNAMEEYEEMLEAVKSNVAQKVLRYRGWSKTTSSNYKAYLDLADSDDILHPNYKVHGTRTGRLSCEHPNLQQIPRETEKEWNGDLKQAFIPRPGHVLIDFDYKQIEVRLAAAIAKETELLEAFNNDVDVYQVMADSLNWARQDCKTFILAVMYGAGINRIKNVFGVNFADAKGMVAHFYDQYPNLRFKAKQAEQLAKRDGFITYWTGRRRHLTEDHRKAFNSVVQGGAFEIVKRSMLRTSKLDIAPMVLTVHDSVVVEFMDNNNLYDNIKRYKNELESVPESLEMGVPFKVDVKKWGSSEPLLGS